MNRRTRIIATSSALAVLAGALFVGSTASASVDTQAQVARDMLANCQLLAGKSTGAQRTRAQQCVTDQTAIIKLLTGATPTTTPTVVPTTPAPTTPAPTTAPPTTVPPSTPPATTPPAADGCPAWPAVPDAACTGYLHTAVTLRLCSSTITTPGTYDSCRFAGGLVIAASDVIVTRSLVDGGHVEGASDANLQGAVLQDVQIVGAGNDGSAAIGNNNYTCRRCDVSAGNRGFAMGFNVVIVDSYAHNFWVQPSTQNSAHQTAISTHGGSNLKVLHSNLRCESDRYACSSGFSFYSEDAPGIADVEVRNCRITSDAGYGMMFGTLIPGKPYGITNTRIIDNVISSDEYGPVANWPGGQTGNIWAGNKTPAGATI